MPKVSVVMPCYNVEKYIEQCIDSLLEQTLDDFEIICVDDGSTDGTLNILNNYAAADSRIRVLEQKNQYAGVARNYGMSVATGEYIIFLDADDFFDPRMLELSYNKAIENDADLVIFGLRRFDDKKQEFNEKIELPRRDLIPDVEVFSALDIPDNLYRITYPAPWTKLYKRSFVDATGIKFQPLANSNDFYFILSTLSLAERICTVQEPLAFYRINMATSTQGSKYKNPLCFLYALEALYEHLQTRGIYDIFEKSFQTVALSSSFYNIKSSSNDNARLTIIDALANNKEGPVYKLLGREREFYSNDNTAKQAQIIYSAVSQRESLKNMVQKAETECVIPYRSDSDISVSVIIPVYNTGVYLDETMESICQQTLNEIEIICINDGSTDNSLDILKRWAEKDKRISVWTQENAGLSCTRNAGVQVARGRYIYFMDSDDILDVRALEVLYEKAFAENLDVIYFDADVFCENPEFEEEAMRYNYKRSKSYSEVYRGQDLFSELYDRKEYFTPACIQMLKREYIEENNFSFHPGIIHEDNAYTFAAMLNAERVSHVNEMFFHRRIRENSIMTSTVSFKNAYGYFISYQDMIQIYSKVEHKLSDKNRSAVMSRLAQNLVNAQTSYANMPKEEIGREYGLGVEKRVFDRLVVRAGNLQRQNDELKKKNGKTNENYNNLKVYHSDLKQRYNKLDGRYKQLDKKYRALDKKYKKLQKSNKRIKSTRFRRFVLCCWDHSFTYAVKLSFKRFFGKLSGKTKK